MKKSDIAIVLILLLFGLIYHAVEKTDFSFLRDISFSTNETELLTDHYIAFLQKEIRFSGVRKIFLENPAGDVKIIKAADNQVSLHPTVRVYHDEKSEAEAIQGQVRIETQQVGQELKISAVHSNFPYRRVRIFFDLAVPADTLLDVNNHHGNVDVRGMNGEIRLNESYGNAVLENIGSSIHAYCEYGDFFLKDIAGQGFIRARYANIKAENVAGLEIDSKHKNTLLRGIQGPAKIDCAYGSIDLDEAESVEISAKHTGMKVNNVGKGCKIRNSYENVWLENVSGPILLSTKYCRLNLSNCRSDSLAIDNSFDNVVIQNFSGINIDVLLRHGKIKLNFAEVRERININCQYGDVVLEMPTGIAPALNIKVKQGDIVNSTGLGIPITQEGVEKYVNLAGPKPEIMVRGTYGEVALKQR